MFPTMPRDRGIVPSPGAGVRAYINEYARPETRNWLETARFLGLRYHGDGEPAEAKGGLAQRWADRPVAGIDGHDIWSVIDEARRVACVRPSNEPSRTFGGLERQRSKSCSQQWPKSLKI